MWTTLDELSVVLVGLWKAPRKRASIRGLIGVFGGFGCLLVFLFLVVEELSVVSNPGCIFWSWACYYIAIKFSTIPAFIGAGGMRRIIDHGRCIVNPFSLVLVVFVRLISKDKTSLQ